jgi:beta-lactamase regulating signal transducer with metallopeptidase domain
MSPPAVLSAFDVPTFLLPLASRIGLALMHAMWEGALIAAVLAAALAFLKRASPVPRYWLSCAAMAALPVASAITFAILPDGGPSELAEPPIVNGQVVTTSHRSDRNALEGGASVIAERANQPVPQSVRDTGPHNHWPLSRALPVLGAAWVIGVMGFSVYRLGGWVVLRCLISRGTVLDGCWPRTLRRLADKLGIRRPVRLLQSAQIAVPMVAGWVRPIVLLPVSAINNMPLDQLEALLAHELAHVGRNDYLVNLVLTAIETVFFCHPLAWWISRQVRREREDCCDDLATGVLSSKVLYARALADLEGSRLGFQPALAASDGNLLRRIRRILGRQNPVRPAAGILVPFICLALAAAGCLALQAAQHQPNSSAPATEPAAASVRSTIAGHVIDSNGKPVAGASLLVASSASWPDAQTVASTTSGKDGEFSIHYSLPNPRPQFERLTLFAFVPNVGLSLSQKFEGKKTVELRLFPSAELHVPFIGPEGRPIVGMKVWPKWVGLRDDLLPFPHVEALPNEIRQQMLQRTDANGVCVFHGLPRAARVLFDDDDDRFTAMNASDYVPLERAGVIQADPIQLAEAGSITGSLVYSDTGKPAGGVQVLAEAISPEAGGFAGRTDAAGRFSIRRLRPGRFLVILGENDPGGEWIAKAAEVEVAAGKLAAADLLLIHGGVLTGMVRDQDTHKGLAGLDVALHGPARPGIVGAVQAGTTDSQGVYRIRVAPGTQSVYLMDKPPDGYLRPEANPSRLQDIVVGDGKTITLNIDLPVDKSPAVNGIVLGPDGKPAAGATVLYSRDEEGMSDRAVKSGPDGRFRARGVPQSAVFKARLNDLATVSPVGNKEDGHDVTLRLSERGIYKAMVRVKDDLGNVVPGASVSLITWEGASGMGSQPHPTGADGTVRFDKLYSDTRYTAMSTTLGRGESSEEIHPPEAGKPGEQVIDLKLFSARGAVSGVVVDEKGRPVPDAEVLLSGPGFGSQTTHGDADGKFKFSVVSTMHGWLYLPDARTREGLPIMAAVTAGDSHVRLVLPSIPKQLRPATPTTRPGS